MTALRRLTGAEPTAALAAAVIATIAAALVLEIWRAPFSIPWDYSGDGNYYGMVVKSILDNGWHYTNPSLGAPAGQQQYDYPIISGENGQALIVKLLGLTTSDWPVVMNVYFLLTFALAGLAAFLVLRRLGSSRGPALACATLFALLPYHFARGENELFISGYFAVPFGAYLALSVLTGAPLFERREGRRRPYAYATRRSLVTVGLCLSVVLASASYYYAAFTLMLAAGATVLAYAVRRDRRALASGGMVVAIVCTGVVATLAPTIAYRTEHGPNPLVGKRGVNESEIFALKLTQLVLPIEGHRLEPLAHRSTRYAETAPFGRLGRAVHLGVVGGLGFAWLLVVAVIGAASRRGWRPGAPYRDAAALNLLAFLIGTVGGLSALIAAVLTPQFRAWNRISIFIAFFGLLAVALALTALGRRWGAGRNGRIGFAAVVLAVLVLGVLDQTSSADVPRYGAIRAEYRSDEGFVRELERRLPAGAAVLQLPYVPFPEAGLQGRLGDYDLARPYLHSNRLRWSFGAAKGRRDDWLASRTGEPMRRLLASAAAAGFSGLVIDRAGYADDAAGVESRVSALLGDMAPLVSQNGRLSFFELPAQPAR